MYQVSNHNTGVHYPHTFATFEEAVAFARAKGFEATIGDCMNGGVAGTWSPITGTSDWRKR